ncbi:MAG TPA: peptidyl-prolyl cis-trans isomerase [Anaeromyxobacter sp.]
MLFSSPSTGARPPARGTSQAVRAFARGPSSSFREGATRMIRRIVVIGLCAAALACSQQKGRKSGAVVAKGNGITITSDEFKARLDEQSPFIRARYTTLDRKKEFLDSLIRFEVLAREAEKQGLAKDPDVQNTLKKIMVQKLVQKNFQDVGGAADVPEPDLQKYYDTHKDEYVRAKRVRVAAVVWNAPQGSPERAKKLAIAQKALAKLKAEEKKNTLAFAQTVAEYSEDAATKGMAGDLQFRTQEELEKTVSKEVADAAFKLKPGETSGIVQAPQGIYLLKYTGEQPEMNRTFDQVKAQIANKLHREKKTKEFDEWLKNLREQAKVTVDDKALDAVEVAAPPQGGMMGGMPGMPMGGAMPPGHGGMPMQPGAAPAPVPAAAPAPAPARK